MQSTETLAAAILALALITPSAMAQARPEPEAQPISVEVPARIGLGQRTATEPAKLSRLGLSDPLVQQKYLNEPDLLRFLRGTYSEACARGYMANTLNAIKSDEKNDLPPEARKASASLLASKRIWKLTSFELEKIFGKAYLVAANHCDCLMQSVSDADLIDPKKGIEVVKGLPKATATACERIAAEKADQQAEASRLYMKKGDRKSTTSP